MLVLKYWSVLLSPIHFEMHQNKIDWVPNATELYT